MQVPALASTTRSSHSIRFAHSPVSGVLNRALGSVLALGLVQAFAVGLVMHLLHQGQHEAHELPSVVHWLRDSALAAPLSVAALAAATAVTRRAVAWASLPARGSLTQVLWALAGALTYAAVSVPGNWAHGRLFGATHEDMPMIAHATHDAAAVMLAAFSVLLALAAVGLTPWCARRTRATAVGLVRAALPSSARGRAATGLAALTVVVLAGLSGSTPLGGLTSAAGDGPCPAGARQITYDVAAFQGVIPLNGWGDHIPDGLMYALKGADARVGKADMVANPNLTQPLVVRANVGDCVTVHLRNDIAGRRVGMHADSIVSQDPKASDGARVGNNPDTTVASGQEISYTWYAEREGQGALADIANLDGADPDHPTIQRGLYGAIVVHPNGSTWRNPKTGDDLLDPATGRAVETQVFADVEVPDAGKDYRSYAMVILDENEGVKDKDGNAPVFPTTGLEDSTFGINYRSEPLRNRMRAILEHRGSERYDSTADGAGKVAAGTPKTVTLPDGRVIEPEDHFCDGYVADLDKVVDDPGAKCVSEESHLQSWIFGDEGKLTRRAADGTLVTETDNLIPKAYKGDPVKFHVVHPGAKETHPWHQHTQRWFADPRNPDSPRNDVQSVGPGDSRELDIEGGAGGVQGTVGDSIFHCHLYPHFAQGFWGHLRIYDRLRDGSQKYPDGTQLEPLKELKDRQGQTPAHDEAHPGYPLFVKGDVGQRAYRPPFAVIKDDFAAMRRPGDAPREPTAMEAANLPALSKDKPGAGYIDPCPADAPMRTYKPHAIDAPITYNSAGWKDPEARMYVEEGQAAAVLSGDKQPEPYTIRARIGDCVQIQTTNDLHKDDDPAKPLDHLNKKDGVYMHETETTEVSTHVHLVKFDELGSDGTSVGWNYVQAAMPGQTYGYRWFVDQPLRTVFFHDHQYANLHQQKGLFAAMNVEPADATWHDPKTGAQTDGVGTVADIRSPSGPDFREISVFHQDRAPMWKNNGAGPAVQPPGAPDDFGADQGGYALNYRNEPFQTRVSPDKPAPKNDPAYVYSSAVHGDPSTPVFRAYPNDPVVVRNVAGSHEEMHTFNIHGHRWLNEPDNPQSATIDNQSIGLAEYFNYEVRGNTVGKQGATPKATQARAGNDAANGTPMIVEGGAGSPGDYLYGSTPLDDQWLGMWGIFRVPGAKVSDLEPLPDNPAPAGTSPWPALKPGDKLAAAPPGAAAQKAGPVCPVGAPQRTYVVSAITTRIVYNEKTGDHDPNGVLYVPTSDVAAVKAGRKKPEPLYIRANEGDCISVSLKNDLPKTGIPAHTGDVPLPADAPFPTSARVSMHPSLVKYDVTRSDGATVGYNYDQTVAPGETIRYTWYARPGLVGGTNLGDFGDRRGHRHHGLWGGLMLEPKGSKWTDPQTGAAAPTGAQADIKWTDDKGTAHAFREFVVGYQDGLNLRDGSGGKIPEAGQVDDPYEQGNRGINYRTERLAPRLQRQPERAWAMSSKVHGDPATPVFRAYVGDPVWFRVLQGQDRGRAHTFLLNGHEWPNQPTDPTSLPRSSQDGVMPGRSFNLGLIGGAGGRQRSSGDYLFRDGLLVNQVNAGLWGLLRVEGMPTPELKPLS